MLRFQTSAGLWFVSRSPDPRTASLPSGSHPWAWQGCRHSLGHSSCKLSLVVQTCYWGKALEIGSWVLVESCWVDSRLYHKTNPCFQGGTVQLLKDLCHMGTCKHHKNKTALTSGKVRVPSLRMSCWGGDALWVGDVLKRVQFFSQMGPFIYSWGKFIYLTLYFELRNWSSRFVILTVVGEDPEAHFPNQRSYFPFPMTESLPRAPLFLGLSNPTWSPWILLSGSLQFLSFHCSPRTTCRVLWPIVYMPSFAVTISA